MIKSHTAKLQTMLHMDRYVHNITKDELDELVHLYTGRSWMLSIARRANNNKTVLEYFTDKYPEYLI
jgi:23S rRNA A2030 N6-methylase RlmJ